MEAACGGREGFEKAKAAGRVYSADDEEGNELWYAKSSEVAKETGIQESKSTKKAVKMTDEQFANINKLLAGLGWDIPKKTKALEDATVLSVCMYFPFGIPKGNTHRMQEPEQNQNIHTISIDGSTFTQYLLKLTWNSR
eukprot:9704620-Karenia_brevis.AAC.1